NREGFFFFQQWEDNIPRNCCQLPLRNCTNFAFSLCPSLLNNQRKDRQFLLLLRDGHSKNIHRNVFYKFYKVQDYAYRKQFCKLDDNVWHLLQTNSWALNRDRRQTSCLLYFPLYHTFQNSANWLEPLAPS